MNRLWTWLRNRFAPKEVAPFNPEDDDFVKRMHEVQDASKQRRMKRLETSATIERLLADVEAANRRVGGRNVRGVD